MKVGLFFGSFNPIHIGHLIIANFMAEFTDLDKVWFVISPHNPFKQKSSLLADHHRLALVRTAIEDNRKLKVSNIEFKLPQPSYTVHTLVHLKEAYPDHEFSLIMGTDNLETFHKWKNYEQILESHALYVYPRLHSDGGSFKNHEKVKIIAAPLIQVTASFIRNAIKNNKDVRYMLSEPVYNYIKEMHFYKN